MQPTSKMCKRRLFKSSICSRTITPNNIEILPLFQCVYCIPRGMSVLVGVQSENSHINETKGTMKDRREQLADEEITSLCRSEWQCVQFADVFHIDKCTELSKFHYKIVCIHLSEFFSFYFWLLPSLHVLLSFTHLILLYMRGCA